MMKNFKSWRVQKAGELFSAQAVRERSVFLSKTLEENGRGAFRFDFSNMERAVDSVVELIEERFPDGHVPLHSRWRHFEGCAGVFEERIERSLKGLSPIERLLSKIDLAIVSVLLDAGAGPQWKYKDQETGTLLNRSEGLAIASLQMFLTGLFSSDKSNPLRVDASRLKTLSEEDLQRGFQVSEQNPLLGLEGRARLLQRVGQRLEKTDIFRYQDSLRPSHLFFSLGIDFEGGETGVSPDGGRKKGSKNIPCDQVLKTLLTGFQGIWSSPHTIDREPLGDVWPFLAEKLFEDTTDEDVFWVPFHKLTQWLTYSLVEPIQEYGVEVTDLDQLTGLPEYRNGGLFVDLGILSLEAKTGPWKPSDPVIVEWRAHTIRLIDDCALLVRKRLSKSPDELPLVSILEGGTWLAGRNLAKKLRPNAEPPLQIISDGNVF
jgi:hypothetical protein